MKDEKPTPGALTTPSMSRREFAALSVAVGVAAVTGSDAAYASAGVASTDVEIHTPGGTCDAAFAHPTGKGPWPAAILFPDIFGLRPASREMANRLAAEGYAVLVPNPFYRSTKAPGLVPGTFNFNSPTDLAQMKAYREPLTPQAVAQDASAYVAWLDARSEVSKKTKIGVFGYCMGGPMTMQAAAANPDRIGAGASFHGGGLVTDQPDSPHLLVPKIRAKYYFGVASNDDAKQPDAKTTLDASFKAAKLEAKIEVYEGALHGWCMKDMPLADGKPLYNEASAERAWKELGSLFKRTLV
jgi:carboxymethylenebutenolidase